MDASTLISPLIGLIAPIVVSAIRRPSSKIEERTARLQYWKTFFEVAPLAGSTVSEDSKQLCLAEMAEGEDETRNFNNKIVSSITTAYTLIVMFLALCLFQRASMFTLNMMNWQYQNQNPPQVTPQQFKELTQQLSYASLIIQALVMCLIWFWARWKIRNFVWDRLRPGKTFHFLLTAGDRMKAFLELVLVILVALAFWAILAFVYQIPLPPFPHTQAP